MEGHNLEATAIPGCNNVGCVASISFSGEKNPSSADASSCMLVGSRDGVHLLYHHGALADPHAETSGNRGSEASPTEAHQFDPYAHEKSQSHLLAGGSAATVNREEGAPPLMPLLESVRLIPTASKPTVSEGEEPTTSPMTEGSATSAATPSRRALSREEQNAVPLLAESEDPPVLERMIQSLDVLRVEVPEQRSTRRTSLDHAAPSHAKFGNASLETHRGLGYSNPTISTSGGKTAVQTATLHISVILCVSYVYRPALDTERIRDGCVAFYYLKIYPIHLNKRRRCPQPTVRLMVEFPFSNWVPLRVFALPFKSLFLVTSASDTTAGKDGGLSSQGGNRWFQLNLGEAASKMEKLGPSLEVVAAPHASTLGDGPAAEAEIVAVLPAKEVSQLCPLLSSLAQPDQYRIFAPVVSLDCWSPTVPNAGTSGSDEVLSSDTSTANTVDPEVSAPVLPPMVIPPPSYVVIGCSDGSVFLFSEGGPATAPHQGWRCSKKQLSSVVSSVQFFTPRKGAEQQQHLLNSGGASGEGGQLARNHLNDPSRSKALDKRVSRRMDGNAPTTGGGRTPSGGASLTKAPNLSFLPPPVPEGEVRFGTTPTFAATPHDSPQSGGVTQFPPPPAIQSTHSKRGPADLTYALSVVALDASGRVVLFHDIQVCELTKVSIVEDRVGLVANLPTEEMVAKGPPMNSEGTTNASTMVGPTMTTRTTVSVGQSTRAGVGSRVASSSLQSAGQQGSSVAGLGSSLRASGGSSLPKSMHPAPPLSALVTTGPDRCVGSVLGRGVLCCSVVDSDCDGYNELVVATLGRRLALCHVQPPNVMSNLLPGTGGGGGGGQSPLGATAAGKGRSPDTTGSPAPPTTVLNSTHHLPASAVGGGSANTCNYEVVDPVPTPSHIFHVGYYNFFGTGLRTLVLCGPNAVWVGFQDLAADLRKSTVYKRVDCLLTLMKAAKQRSRFQREMRQDVAQAQHGGVAARDTGAVAGGDLSEDDGDDGVGLASSSLHRHVEGTHQQGDQDDGVVLEDEYET